MASNDDSRDSKVRTVLDKWEAAWNAADMNAMWQLATDEVHWVNVVGQHWQGKAEVQKAHQMNFDRLRFKDRSCKLEAIESVEALPGGAVASRKRSHVFGARASRRRFCDRARRQRSHR
jgi:uncharacterized protein (TIGR02246 family)